MLTFWIYRYPGSKQEWAVITKEKREDDAPELKDGRFPTVYARYLTIQHIFGVKIKPGQRVMARLVNEPNR